jgi:hypothetical protein
MQSSATSLLAVKNKRLTINSNNNEDRDQAYAESDVKHKAKLLRKMDIRLIPVSAILNFISFLNRGNIGNARFAGLKPHLDLVGSE